MEFPYTGSEVPAKFWQYKLLAYNDVDTSASYSFAKLTVHLQHL